MLLGPVDVHCNQVCDVGDEVGDAEEPKFDTMTLNFTWRYYSCAKGNQHG